MARRTRFRLSTDSTGALWFAVALEGGWTACYRLRARDGRPFVTELRVVPTPPDEVVNLRKDGEPQGHHEPPGDGLTAGILKDEVVIGRHVYELLPEALRMASRKGQLGGEMFGEMVGALGFDADAKPIRGRRGPKGWPDEDYVSLAVDYIARCKSGSRSPVADLAEGRGTSVEAMRQALYRARKRGLLTKQKKGRAGGQLTTTAKKLLRKARRERKTKGRG